MLPTSPRNIYIFFLMKHRFLDAKTFLFIYLSQVHQKLYTTHWIQQSPLPKADVLAVE